MRHVAQWQCTPPPKMAKNGKLKIQIELQGAKTLLTNVWFQISARMAWAWGPRLMKALGCSPSVCECATPTGTLDQVGCSIYGMFVTNIVLYV